ncbi:hypothetical protein BBK14_00080 [Parafrankia soli]|uniref:Winged helix-turn-helix domain-containing protein n=1 Tax=Parafrankia soli TaxID=2599596 RepID=A0A1S1RJ09_9ACTN|nr:crosslink repair DNA glycosylase YcaQ family protein [Parafrankia soli]OHV46723.1 hypothetical protein BBK14_00080 [Parafrankia soli]
MGKSGRGDELTPGEVRRLALAAQGLIRPHGPAPAGARAIRNLFDLVGVVQIDSANVLARAHYLPGFSRFGPYPTNALDSHVHTDRKAFEYWAHEASLVPVQWQPLFRWRAERALATELRTLARWLELDGIEVEPRGSLAGALACELGSRSVSGTSSERSAV